MTFRNSAEYETMEGCVFWKQKHNSGSLLTESVRTENGLLKAYWGVSHDQKKAGVVIYNRPCEPSYMVRTQNVFFYHI